MHRLLFVVVCVGHVVHTCGTEGVSLYLPTAQAKKMPALLAAWTPANCEPLLHRQSTYALVALSRVVVLAEQFLQAAAPANGLYGLYLLLPTACTACTCLLGTPCKVHRLAPCVLRRTYTLFAL